MGTDLNVLFIVVILVRYVDGFYDITQHQVHVAIISLEKLSARSI